MKLIVNLLILSITTTFKYFVISETPGAITPQKVRYEPNWNSLDQRPLPIWYDQVKFGIFIHWGVYSVPSFGSEWFWKFWKENKTDYVEFMRNNYPKDFSYQDFARDFKAEFFNATEWIELFKKAGAKYVVLTSKHHEGYTLWPSKYSFSWNAKDVGPHRDLVGELGAAAREAGFHFGLYHSLYEWFNPLYMEDRKNNYKTKHFVDEKVIPEMKELIETYKPEILWSDGEGEAVSAYWESTEFLAWLYNESPVRDVIVTNDRWGNDTPCHHGGFYSCADRYNPGVLQPHKWENAMTIDRKSWGYRRNIKAEELLTARELIETLVVTVSCGGNLLMNVGPTKEGTVIPVFQERLLEMGEWLSVNGEAIFETTPWTHQNDTNGYSWYTAKGGTVYAVNLKWPEDGVVKLWLARDLFSGGAVVKLLDKADDYELSWKIIEGVVEIYLPNKSYVSGELGWVVRIDAN